MTIKIQVIGLPGSGKTTYIRKFLEQHPDVQYLDICNFTGRCREQKFRRAFKNAQGPIIAESACGIYNAGYIIRVNTPIQTTYRQLKARDDKADLEYLSLLSTQIVPAHCTLRLPEDLPGQLQTILRR